MKNIEHDFSVTLPHSSWETMRVNCSWSNSENAAKLAIKVDDGQITLTKEELKALLDLAEGFETAHIHVSRGKND